MNTTHNIPSIFEADSDISGSVMAAPSFVIYVTAAVLGALIAEHGILTYADESPFFLRTTERVIAKAVDGVIEKLDMVELNRAYDARHDAISKAAQDARAAWHEALLKKQAEARASIAGKQE